ncbi:MAG: hypothetical protein Hens3KO_28810 [Henriciella sp.]
MTGKLTLIGCGPGATDLLTLRAVQRIAAADMLLYDRLVEPDLLCHASPHAECVYVGKGCRDGGRQQDDINLRLKTALEAGKHVARLKSGDPMVFGRAAEELAVAIALDVEIEIVPGVTAALAAASDALITVTERAELQSFVVTTARAAKQDEEPDWADLVKPGVCAAFYMGVAQAWRIQSNLMAAGLPGHVPADWIENAGRETMRAIPSQLDRLALDAKQHSVSNPAILLVRYPLSLAQASRKPATEALAAF